MGAMSVRALAPMLAPTNQRWNLAFVNDKFVTVPRAQKFRRRDLRAATLRWRQWSTRKSRAGGWCAS